MNRLLIISIGALFLLLLLPIQAIGGEVPSMGSMAWKMTWALLIVAGLILIIYGLVRKKMGFITNKEQQIKIIEMRPLLNKGSLALVEVENKKLLLGIGAETIQLLAELDSSSHTEDKSFQDILSDTQ